MKKVMVIGGGASGIVAAISAARHGAEVTILEHNDRIGKKILSTGNGKCNYTNRRQGLRFYRGENPAFVLPVLKQFGFKETIAFFKELGIYPKERDGYFYPASGQASSVLDVLRMELDNLSVKVKTGCQLNAVQKSKNGFQIRTSLGTFQSDSLLFACGGKAFPKSGSDGSAFPYISKFGHTWIEMTPALVQMKAKQSFFKLLAGIRADCSVTLNTPDGEYRDRGEVQFTSEGISGIPSFQLSRYAAKAIADGKKAEVSLDLAPFLTEEELRLELNSRFRQTSRKTCEEALIGLFSKKFIPVLLKENHIPLKTPANQLTMAEQDKLLRYLKHMDVTITAVKGFDFAQTAAGGVDTAELHAHTLESKLVKGLYFAGEVIDIDGMCGGYNLQWAWSSGYVAGRNAARRDGSHDSG